MKRLVEVDMLKGFSILLVMVGSFGVDLVPAVNEVLAGFRMPLLFMLAGYLYSVSKYKRMGQLISKKIQRLIVPYFSFAGIGVLLHLLQNGQNPLKDLLGILYGIGQYLQFNTPIWFLTCLFVSFIVFFMMLKLLQKKSKAQQLLVLLVLAFIGYGTGQLIALPWSIDLALITPLFMYIGYHLKKSRLIYNKKKLLLIGIICTPLFIFFNQMNGAVDLNTRMFGSFPLFLIEGITGSIMVIMLVKFLFSKMRVLRKGLTFLGENAILYLGLHMAVGTFISYWLQQFTGFDLTQLAVIYIVLTVAICTLFITCINRITWARWLLKGEMPNFNVSGKGKNFRVG